MHLLITSFVDLLKSNYLLLLKLAILAFVYYAYRLILRYIPGSATLFKDAPGPRGIPIFGNEFQIPTDKQWLRFHEWSQKYGDVVRITTMGQPVIILSSANAAFELLETRGTVYSSRPRAVMAGELVGWNRGLGYTPYGERFKEFRKLFHRILGPRPVHDFRHLQLKSVRRLLLNLLENPEEFDLHARQSAGSTIVMISYGYNAQPPNDPLLHIAEVAMKGFSKASEPGAFMVDRFPFLKHVPSLFPGAEFKQLAKQWRKDLERLYDVPFEFVKSEMAAGRAIPSFTSKCLSQKPHCSDEEANFIKAAAASIYSAGVDTTPSAIVSFILAMTLRPEIQAKAQAEVDAVIGAGSDVYDGAAVGARTEEEEWKSAPAPVPGRLPTFEDRKHMPYVNALVKEVLRWNPSVPLGLPHEVVQDDVYRGYRILKGATVWANIWSMLHDESFFPNPHSFEPERYLDYEENTRLPSASTSRRIRLKPLERSADPSCLAFGFGRRICPGLHLADDGIFIAIASILAVFDIRKARDEHGEEIVPRVEYEGFLSHPKPFCCTIRRRSEAASHLIKRASEE